MPTEVIDVLAEYEKLSTDRARFTNEIQRAQGRLGSLEGQRQGLVVAVADGDKRATAQLDAIDKQKIEIDREVQGLQIKITQADAQMASIAPARAQIFEARQREEHAKVVAAYGEKLQRLHNDLTAIWRAGCLKRFEQCTTVFEISTDPRLSDSEQGTLLTRFILAQAELATQPQNQQWEIAKGHLPNFPPIVPAKPPAEKRERVN